MKIFNRVAAKIKEKISNKTYMEPDAKRDFQERVQAAVITMPTGGFTAGAILGFTVLLPALAGTPFGMFAVLGPGLAGLGGGILAAHRYLKWLRKRAMR